MCTCRRGSQNRVGGRNATKAHATSASSLQWVVGWQGVVPGGCSQVWPSYSQSVTLIGILWLAEPQAHVMHLLELSGETVIATALGLAEL